VLARSCSCLLCRENGININSTNQKDNFLINSNHSIDNYANHNLNSYAKSTTITSTNNNNNNSTQTSNLPSNSPTSRTPPTIMFYNCSPNSQTQPSPTNNNNTRQRTRSLSISPIASPIPISTPPPTLTQLRILIPYSNYDNLLDNIRSQQSQSVRPGSSQQQDRRNMQDNRRMNMGSSIDRQMVRVLSQDYVTCSELALIILGFCCYTNPKS
jgi:hypothetical protein